MKFQTLDSFEKHLRSAYPNSLAKTYGVVAPQKADRDSISERLKKGFLTLEPGLEIFHFNGASFTSVQIQSALNAQSLFSKNNLILIDELEKGRKQEIEQLIALFPSIPDGSRLLFNSASTQGLKELLNLNSSDFVVLDLSQEKPWDRKERCIAHLIQYARRAQVQLQADAAELLIDHVGQESQDLERECEKLICFASSEGKIDRAAVERLVPMRVPLKRFKISQEWVFGAPEISPRDFENGDLFQWIGQIRYHLQMGLKLLFLSSEELQNQMNPKETARLMKVARTFGPTYFEKGLEALVEMEMMAKNGSLSEEILLHTYIGKLDNARKTYSSS